jgi:hypothetical protein
MNDIPGLLDNRQKIKNRDQIQKIDLFNRDPATNNLPQKSPKLSEIVLKSPDKSPKESDLGGKSFRSIEKVNTFAGVTDDTIYGHQPSNNDPTDYQTNFSKNSNFKSAYNGGKQSATIKQEEEIMEAISALF